jgi:aminoglycoside phosphotransferase (APT) family kinase protein
VAADPEGVLCDVPTLLLTRLPGKPPRPAATEIDGFCRQLAETIAQIHDLRDLADARLEPYRLYYDRAHASLVRWIPANAVWTEAIDTVREPPPTTVMTLIHRDYHPENTLWSGGRLTAVVDWTQASRGPAALDLAHMRWNLVADYGQPVADCFLAYYPGHHRSRRPRPPLLGPCQPV